MTIIPQALRDYITTNLTNDAFTWELIQILEANGIIKPHAASGAPQRQGTINQPSSPHASTGKKKGKPPFWLKVVTSYDNRVPNGYGLKGRFIYKDKIDTLTDFEVAVLVWKNFTDPKKPGIYLLRRSVGEKASIKTPQNQIEQIDNATLVCEASSFRDLFSAFDAHGIPMTQYATQQTP